MKRLLSMVLMTAVLFSLACSSDSATEEGKDVNGGDQTSEDAALDNLSDDLGVDMDDKDVATEDKKAPDVTPDLGDDECEDDNDCNILLGPQPICKRTYCDTNEGKCKVGDAEDNTACEDGDKCTMGSVCTAGVCGGGVDANCDDTNPCTDDTCDPATGCVHTNNSIACDDGDECTGDDVCTDGQCEGATDLCPAICGDSTCDATEDCTSCPADCGACPPVCGDTVCDEGESCETCPQDCTCDAGDCCQEGPVGQCTDQAVVDCVCAEDSYCCNYEWDSTCIGEVNEFGCGFCPAICGDYDCTGDETCETCPDDCGECVVCGDGTCSWQEDCEECPEDCGACPFCGDGTCDWDESCTSCEGDCGVCPSCGDGTCNGDEDCADCPGDCGACEFCPGYAGANTCCQVSDPCEWFDDSTCDCGGTCDWDKDVCLQKGCGDAVCDTDEDCSSCTVDCGKCLFCEGYTGSSTGCTVDNPKGWDVDGYCDCDGTCEWDKLDCTEQVCGDGVCYKFDEDCSTCPADCGECDFCEGYTGTSLACQNSNPSGYEYDGYCDCDGACAWEELDCTDPVCGDGFCYKYDEDCTTCPADCGECTFCTGYTGTSTCCQEGDPCGYADDWYCDCDGTCSWDAYDCEYEWYY